MFANALKPTHIIILLVIVLLLFGAKRLPDLAKSVGQSMKIFKKEIKDLTSDDDDTTTPAPAQPAAVAPVVPPVVTAPAPRTQAESTTPPQV